MLVLVLVGCTPSKDDNTAKLIVSMAFELTATRSFDVHVVITVDEPVEGFEPKAGDIAISSDHGAVGPVTALSNLGMTASQYAFSATLSPPDLDDSDDIWTGEINVNAVYRNSEQQLNESVHMTALVLSEKQVGLGQTEAVRGLVNTLGVEDSPQVSADGQWLTVGTYSPVDLGFCTVQQKDPDAVGCNQNHFDRTGRERPNMFGADRILDDMTIDHAIPSINYDPSSLLTPIAAPPVASYGFRRLEDGSYGEPFVIGIDAGGYTWQAPYGYSFDDIVGDQARVFYSYNDLSDNPDSLTDIYFSTITLGVANILGTYESSILQGFNGAKVPIDGTLVCGDPYCEYGNPHITTNRLWFDNERQTNDLFFIDVSRDGAGNPTSFSTPTRVPVSQATRGESMPFMDGDLLYYQCDTNVCRSRLTAGEDPALPGSWQPEQVVLTGSSNIPWQIKGGRSGRVVATAEPSVASIIENGRTRKWLYFVYLLQIHYGAADDEFGANWNVGRVRLQD